jgi:hypothetical protein
VKTSNLTLMFVVSYNKFVIGAEYQETGEHFGNQE